MSLLEEAKELIEMSLDTDIEKVEYDRKARRWLEKTTEMLKSHAEHHKHQEEGAS